MHTMNSPYATHVWDVEGVCRRCGIAKTADWHGSTCDEMLAFHAREKAEAEARAKATAEAKGITLKPCPFCGSEAEVLQAGTPRRSTIIACTDCGCRLGSNEHSHWIGSQWNSRREST
jgi:Lar family restriction alleviation protein